ncbi:MAG: glycoside hydrolase family 31 protein [Clostridia bacterium]|nr:glycoside hydrolase family 31 protein [Clostridia bacterium]
MKSQNCQSPNTTAISVSAESAVQNVQKSDQALYFCTAEGLFLRLSYEGTNGWRLQANQKGYAHFEDMGATQSLARFMGEEVRDLTENVGVSEIEGALKVTCEAGSFVLISTTADFSMSFCSAQGEVLKEIDSIVAEEERRLVMRGTLDENEAVIGGGQRFDAVNRRGSSMILYSYDGYNTDRGRATYMPIPLFITTRGAGTFVNRYERIEVAFGKAPDNNWEIAILNDMIDVYVMVTGNMSDVLRAYTEMAGGACASPTEWMQDVLICRYGPDMIHFDKDCVTYHSVAEMATDWEHLSKNLYADRECTVRVTDENLDILNNEGQYVYGIFSNGSRLRCFHYENGTFTRITKKGHPAGYSVKTIVENLTRAGMKPKGVYLEGFPTWKDITADTERAKHHREEIKQVTGWLRSQGIKSMLYMAVAQLDANMKGYKPEYQVWVDITDANGEVNHTWKIPQHGFSANPDIRLNNHQNYLDITNPEAVNWYMDEIWQDLIDLGIDGIKIDFCEMMPDEGSYCTYNPDGSIAKQFSIKYHWYDESVFEGDVIHHAYPTYFISLFCKKMNEKIAKRADGDGFMVLSRGGALGSQRNPYLWAGDQTRIFHNLQTQLTSVLTSGASGVPYMTYDMAGYGYPREGLFFGNFKEVRDGNRLLDFPTRESVIDYESEIFMRGTEYSAFTHCMQTHGDVRHLYDLTEQTQTVAALYTDLHRELLPYIQKVSRIASKSGMPVVRPMVLMYPADQNVHSMIDEFMLGDALLVAPVLTQGSVAREVYLPAGEWLDLISGKTLSGAQTLTVNAGLAQIPVFLNLASADATDLKQIFEGETWKKINTL